MARRSAPLLAACELVAVAKQRLATGMGFQILPQHLGKKLRERNAPRRVLTADALLFPDRDRPRREIHVRYADADELRSPRPGVSRGARYRVDPEMAGLGPYDFKR